MGHTSKANIPEISVFYVRAATMSWGNDKKVLDVFGVDVVY